MSMLNCQNYIFLLTSGQLDDAGWELRLRASHHRLICRHCRAFTRNDKSLDLILDEHRQRLEVLAQAPSDKPGESG